MSQQELLKYLVQALQSAGIPYMVTGSTVSSLQGQPRTTHDIDVIVDLHRPNVPVFLAIFPTPRFYLDEDAVRDGINSGLMFNALDTEGGDKIDFWPLKREPFDQSAFKRRVEETAVDVTMCVSQPEDTILSKLRWAKECGGSEKQVNDCVGVYEVNYTNLDMEYLQKWAQILEVTGLLAQVRNQAQTD